MLAVDTNVLFPAVVRSHDAHAPARDFLDGLRDRDDVVVSELVLLELYILLRNPVVLDVPRPPAEAVAVCQAFRSHPRWQVVGLPEDGRVFHDALWPMLADRRLTRRRAFDLRLGLSLRRQGVDEFATVNMRDFAGLGFRRVWNPLRDRP
jgi:toxin-antitoxin system PIN domain toxin